VNYDAEGALRGGRLLEVMVHPMYDDNGILVDTDIPMNEEKFDIMGL
jgi:hypothetical protein